MIISLKVDHLSKVVDLNKKTQRCVESFFKCPGLDSNQHTLADAAT